MSVTDILGKGASRIARSDRFPSHVQTQAVLFGLWSKAVRLTYLDQATLQDCWVRCKGRPSLCHVSSGVTMRTLGKLSGCSCCFTVLAMLTDEDHHMNLAEPQN